MLTLTLVCLIPAIVPAILFCINLRLYAQPPFPAAGQPSPCVSVLIPARNEERSIGEAIAAVLASERVAIETIVLDDHSEDRTAAIVENMAATDDRVRLVPAPELPAGWCGKQHACWTLSRIARYPLLVFIDADVRLSPSALARMAHFMARSGADLASGIPSQETVGLLERLVIPLIHFIMLGFLPMWWMRRSSQPSFSAGCGQLFIARREAYDRAGGHASIPDTLHDGIKLPRAFRAAGLRTDLFDATDLATCRMYRSAREVWFGLAKNAGEALAAPRLIIPMTVILIGGQVMPLFLLTLGLLSWPSRWPARQLAMAILATALAYYPRVAAAVRYRQSALGAALHPVGILVLVTIQWFAFFRNILGKPSTWKGRPYPRPSRIPHQAHAFR